MRGASLITLLAAVLVLGGALAAGHRHRVYDAVILKTLGATRGRLLAPTRSNTAARARDRALRRRGRLACGLAWSSTEVMNLTLHLAAGAGGRCGAGRSVLTVALRPDRHLAALGQKPAPVLRNL